MPEFDFMIKNRVKLGDILIHLRGPYPSAKETVAGSRLPFLVLLSWDFLGEVPNDKLVFGSYPTTTEALGGLLAPLKLS